MIGRIIKVISNDYTVISDNKRYICKARGVFRNQNITPFAGDIVTFDENNLIITKIHDRKNELSRPPVSNVDIAIIVMSTIKPDFSTNLIDKLITIIEMNNIKPVICITKSDLFMNDEIKKSISYYKKIGYDVFYNTEIDKIKNIIKGKMIILTGQSGAGKSSLLNRLDSDLNLKTDDISIALGRGKHTTRAIEYYEINGGFVADTPGFSLISFVDISKETIRDNFIEFNKYRNECKYSDCMHIKEDECKIKELVQNDIISKERYDNYLSFIREWEDENSGFNTKRKK